MLSFGRSLLFVFATVCLQAVNAQIQPPGAPFLSPVTVASGLAANVIFSNLTAPRGIAFDSNQNLLVVERGLGVTAFTQLSPASLGWERTIVVANTALTHGIEVLGAQLYVSTGAAVLLYTYDPVTKTVASKTPFTLIDGLPADGELTTHALLLEKKDGIATGIFVGSGPLTNIDPTARDPANGRSQVRKFVFPFATPGPNPTTLHWANGAVIAYGIRNPAAFAFEPLSSTGSALTNTLHIVENGASIDNVTGITAAFANDNPADEIEVVDLNTTTPPGPFFGFPDCTSLWNPKADPVGVPQYAGLAPGEQISLQLDPVRTDAWCRIAANNKLPAVDFQAHSVPLDIKFYTPQRIIIGPALPSTWAGDAFVSFRGSFNRSPPTGYGVVRVPFPYESNAAKNDYSFLVQAKDLTTCPGTCIRPVGLAFLGGRLFVSSDSSKELFVIQGTAV